MPSLLLCLSYVLMSCCMDGTSIADRFSAVTAQFKGTKSKQNDRSNLYIYVAPIPNSSLILGTSEDAERSQPDKTEQISPFLSTRHDKDGVNKRSNVYIYERCGSNSSSYPSAKYQERIHTNNKTADKANENRNRIHAISYRNIIFFVILFITVGNVWSFDGQIQMI